MTELFDIEKNFKYMINGSLIGLLIVFLILFGSYYNFFKYVNIQMNNNVVFGCWIYLFLNIGVANLLKYINKRIIPPCPNCKSKLKITNYKCKECGELHFKK